MSVHSSSPLPTPQPLCAQFAQFLPLLSSRDLDTDQEFYLREHLTTCAWCQAKLASFEAAEEAIRRHLGAEAAEQPVFSLDDLLRAARRATTSLSTPAERRNGFETTPQRPPSRKTSTEPSVDASSAGDDALQATRSAPPGAQLSAHLSSRVGALGSSLVIPDAPWFHTEESYSPFVANALTRAYQCVAHEGQYALAAATIAQCLDHPMSLRQRLCVCFVRGMASVAEDALWQAIACLDEALDLTLRLDDLGACAELAFLQASIFGVLQRSRQAVEYYGVSLDCLLSLGGEVAPADPAFELDVLMGLSAFEFMLARYDGSLQHLDEARRLIALAPTRPEAVAPIEWITSLSDRWRGELPSGLRHAMAACEIYRGLGLPAPYATIQTVVADIALDLAESFPMGESPQARDAFVTLARPYSEGALLAAHSAHDRAGEAVAQLGQARYARVRGGGQDSTATIDAVIRTALQLGDIILLGEAHTALGHTFAARGEIASALNCYRRALDMLEKSEAPALSVWPRRELLRISEMRSG